MKDQIKTLIVILSIIAIICIALGMLLMVLDISVKQSPWQLLLLNDVTSITIDPVGFEDCEPTFLLYYHHEGDKFLTTVPSNHAMIEDLFYPWIYKRNQEYLDSEQLAVIAERIR